MSNVKQHLCGLRESDGAGEEVWLMDVVVGMGRYVCVSSVEVSNSGDVADE